MDWYVHSVLCADMSAHTLSRTDMYMYMLIGIHTDRTSEDCAYMHI